MSDETVNNEEQKKRKKSRTYISQSDIPAHSINDALRIPRAIIENYAGKPTTPLNVASALDLTPNSSLFRMLCGSSIAYGLTKGGYNASEIAIEPIAKRIISPTLEGDDIIAKRQAILQPKILGDFIRKYDNSPIPKKNIAINVLKDMNVPNDRAEEVFDMIMASAESVGFIKVIKERQYIDLSGTPSSSSEESTPDEYEETPPPPITDIKAEENKPLAKQLGQGIFISHGKDKKPLDQLKKILDQFRIPYKVAVDEPNLGRPISSKVKETMESCNCAILIFSADEESIDKDGNVYWRPSDNVVHELGAAGYLYGNRIVILKEEDVVLSTNFSDLGYISFTKDQLENKSVDVLKELLGFGIVKIST